MVRRTPDGRYRNHNRSMAVANSVLIARWVEAEVLRLKHLGLAFATIARQIAEVGRGEQRPLTPFHPGMTFPPGYKITVAGVCKAFDRALKREPRLAADKLRRLNTQRCEQMLLALQPLLQQGDAKAILAAVRLLEHQASINGIKSTKPSDPPVAEVDEPRRPPGVIVGSFAGALDLMAKLGVQFPGFRIIRDNEPKAIETTAINPAEKEEPQDEEKPKSRGGDDIDE